MTEWQLPDLANRMNGASELYREAFNRSEHDGSLSIAEGDGSSSDDYKTIMTARAMDNAIDQNNLDNIPNNIDTFTSSAYSCETDMTEGLFA